MSEAGSISDDIREIKFEVQAAHFVASNTHESSQASRAEFNQRFDAFDKRLGSFEKLLRRTLGSRQEQDGKDAAPTSGEETSEEPNEEVNKEDEQKPQKWGRGTFVQQSINDITTKRIDKLETLGAKRDRKQPKRFGDISTSEPVAKKPSTSLPVKASAERRSSRGGRMFPGLKPTRSGEIKNEDISVVRTPRRADSKKKTQSKSSVNAALVGGNDRSDAHSANKTKRKDKSEKEELSAPTKRKQKTPKLPTIKELDEDDETIHVVKRKERVSTGKNADLSEPRTGLQFL
jgi:hypothetical protein